MNNIENKPTTIKLNARVEQIHLADFDTSEEQKELLIQSLSSSQTTSRDAKPTQHIEITHPNNVNLKLAFHKVASFHPHYSTFTPQTYHHPVHRFRSWPMQMTSQSHPHTQVRVHPRNTYNHTYTKFLPGQNKTTSY